MKAIFDGVVLAESDKVVQLEGNNYYPLDSLNMEHFSPIEKTTSCGWKVRAALARPRSRASARARATRGGRPWALPSLYHLLCDQPWVLPFLPLSPALPAPPSYRPAQNRRSALRLRQGRGELL